ncbi:MAG: DNA topoisomerase IB [Planctomycetota bacterium]
MADDETDKYAIAKGAGLRLWADTEKAYSRRRCGSGFAVLDEEGQKVADRVRERIDDLVIPPAWTEVRICPNPKGHLQATGRDAAGRKQYLYHPDWHEAVRRHKFADLAEFGESLGDLRERIDSDLRRRTPGIDRTVALAVALIDRTGIRVGSPEYTRDNETHGLTTLLKPHLHLGKTYARFCYEGKAHQPRDLRVNGRRWARHLERMKATPGDRLMRYRSTPGWCDLDGGQINDYLQRFASGSPSAKRFRTWIGSLVAFIEVQRQQATESSTKRVAQAAVRRAASVLGNTIAVCREHYIHPAVLRTPLEAVTTESAADDLRRDDLLAAEPQLLSLLHAC